jgi:hypothetical protein
MVLNICGHGVKIVQLRSVRSRNDRCPARMTYLRSNSVQFDDARSPRPRSNVFARLDANQRTTIEVVIRNVMTHCRDNIGARSSPDTFRDDADAHRRTSKEHFAPTRERCRSIQPVAH